MSAAAGNAGNSRHLGDEMAHSGDHAVVLGGSMAGMLAARVLSDFYRTVTVVERDSLPLGGSGPRRGVPQGRHAHALTAGGARIVGELFPGLLDELVAGGAPIVKGGDYAGIDLTLAGHQLVRSGQAREPLFDLYSPSRPFLECHVRRRLRDVGNVRLLDCHEVVELTSRAGSDRVDAVALVNRTDGEGVTLTADLVVDATGRGSRTPAFLEQLGFSRPVEQEVVIRVAYSSLQLKLRPDALTERLVNVFPVVGRPRLVALAANEDDTWMLTVGGMFGVEPPADFDGMLDFIEDFMPAYAMAALRLAEPVSDVARYRVPSNRWRRYDKLRRMPAGLLVFGDAVCSFDPIYGQGMSVAAMEAIALRDCLGRGDHKLPQRFTAAAAKVVRVAWQMAAGSDLAFPEAEGNRTTMIRLTNWYTDKLLTAAETDPYVAEKFMRAAGFIDPPTALVHPSVVRRVMFPRRADTNVQQLAASVGNFASARDR
jgi:2-polyprenyl-6-methoxyphenol hydroxylase-like FAD-dependent oxidoreductase